MAEVIGARITEISAVDKMNIIKGIRQAEV